MTSSCDKKHGCIPSSVLKSLTKLDVVVFIEHCFNCEHHDISLRHDQQKYYQLANYHLRNLALDIHENLLNTRLGNDLCLIC